ncbi:glycosyl hydrolase 108 family protein [Prosthecobacter sp.]|uniref:glycosyl hydrolase 108 family protein n=1 Tax=Prosthecobacter sp. TaxID=1965333 RepID=UPI00248943FC|nr:glycosyl hydrolase 108 family protein [Prosthecobacter sp.]MDI1313799.1 glycosyl hydrolase 108 family protein [Prosthecobacter sp.]
MPNIAPINPVETVDQLNDVLNDCELLDNHQVFGLVGAELGADKLNRVVTITNLKAKKLLRLVTKEVPAGALRSDIEAAATAQGKAAAREAFLTFATELLQNDEALFYGEAFIGLGQGDEVKRTDILLLRTAPPLPPRKQTREASAKETLNATPPAEASEAFRNFMPFIFEWEGETYENDKNDPGGATKFGIDQRSHPNVNIKGLTKDVALAIYWEEWKHDGCPGLATPPYAEVFFNCAVNMGAGRARSFHVIANGNPSVFVGLQEKYYRRLGAQDKYKTFLNGWLNRTNALRKRFGI